MKMKRDRFGFWLWVANRLPANLVYACYIKVVAHATTGEYGSTNATDVTVMEVLDRYSKDMGL